MNRRMFLPLAGAAGVAAFVGRRKPEEQPAPFGPPGNSAVSILRARSYEEDLTRLMLAGIAPYLDRLRVKGKRVLLKPNLVEFDPSTVINTDARFVAAALETFRALGAAEVRIGEGPGHRRDTYALADDAAYRRTIPHFDDVFTDLNRDDVSAVSDFSEAPEMFFPAAALGADLIVSLAKMKTHHWAGATLSMKNLFGLVPGSVYGWPKNKLHYIGISQSVAALNRKFRNTFALVDGIVGMEGNGPIQGTPKNSGVIVMGHDLVAVDATCCRIMGISPEKIEYLTLASSIGHTGVERIDQRGETIESVRSNFALIPEFQSFRLA